MSNENASLKEEQCTTTVEPVVLPCNLVVCQLCGVHFVTTSESCVAMGGTIILSESSGPTLSPDELIICQLSGEDFVTTPESCLAMGGTIVGQPTSPGSQAVEAMRQDGGQ